MKEIKKHAVSVFVLLCILLTASVVRANETEIALRIELVGAADEDNEPLVHFADGSDASERKGDAAETMLEVELLGLAEDLSR